MKSTIILVLLCACFVCVTTSKVLVVSPAVSKSVYFVLNAISQELSNRGHEVVILAPDSEQYLKKNHLVQFFPIDEWWRGVVNGTINFKINTMSALEKLRFFSKMQKDVCDALLNSKILDQHRGAEVFIGVTVLSCSFVIPHILGVPHVSILPAALNIPILRGLGQKSPIAYVPQLESRSMPNMTFLGRVKNFGMYYISEVFINILFYASGNEFVKKCNITHKSFKDMVADTDLVLLQADYALEDAQPVVPNVKLIGPVLPQPAKQLDPELAAFMNSAGPEGVVLVSFGSVEVSGVRTRLADEVMARALAKLPFKVVWKIKDFEGLPIGANTKALSWIKQNDILGHPKTRVFVTHVGHNGMYESAYHGVPMVACPQWGDQYDNSARLVYRGVAVQIDVTDLENLETALLHAVNKIATDPSYSKRIKKISRVIRSRKRTPREEAADWIEHVLEVKDMSYLKPLGNSMPLYQLYLVDVMAFFIFLFVVFITLTMYCIKYCKKCFNKKHKEKAN